MGNSKYEKYIVTDLHGPEISPEFVLDTIA